MTDKAGNAHAIGAGEPGVRKPDDRTTAAGAAAAPSTPHGAAARAPREVGGPAGPEPTRYGDWEKAGRCIDF